MAKKGEGANYQWLKDRATHQDSECLIWPFSKTRGYGGIVINRKHQYAHRVMCVLAHGEPPSPAHQAAHSCGNGHKGCVHPQHLSWKTPSENQLDRRQHGTGKRNPNGRSGKITPRQAKDIRALAGTKTQDEIAAMFNTSRSNVQFIIAGKTKLKVFGLPRKRVKEALAKAEKPMSGPEITVAAQLSSTRKATSLLFRMVRAGEVMKVSYGLFAAVPQTSKHP